MKSYPSSYLITAAFGRSLSGFDSDGADAVDLGARFESAYLFGDSTDSPSPIRKTYFHSG